MTFRDYYERKGWRPPFAYLIACFLLSSAIATPVSAFDPTMLAKRLEHLSASLAGKTGVAAALVGSGPMVLLNGDDMFPMASTYKVAIAVAVLHDVDEGKLSLDQMLSLQPEDMIAGSGDIAKNFVHAGVQLSLANLIEAMITESDNSATDKCMELVSGPKAVTARLRELGIEGQRIDHDTADLLSEFYDLPQRATLSYANQILSEDPGLVARIPLKNLAFEEDLRNQSTPRAMLDLLLQIHNGTALSTASTEFLIGVLSRTRTAKTRLPGLLPHGTKVAHKSGTIGGIANDVGYITLPDARTLAVAVFTKSSDTSSADRDRAVAEVARSLYEAYANLPTSVP